MRNQEREELKQVLGTIREYDSVPVEELKQGDIFITLNNSSVVSFRIYLGMNKGNVERAIRDTKADYETVYLENYKDEPDELIQEIEHDLKGNCDYFALSLFGMNIALDKDYLLKCALELLEKMTNDDYCIKFDNDSVNSLYYTYETYRIGNIEKDKFNLWLMKLKLLNPDLNIDYIENDVLHTLLEDTIKIIAQSVKSFKDTIYYDVISKKIPLSTLPKKHLRTFCFRKEDGTYTSVFSYCFVTYSRIYSKYCVKTLQRGYAFDNSNSQDEVEAFNDLCSRTSSYTPLMPMTLKKTEYVDEKDIGSYFVIKDK